MTAPAAEGVAEVPRFVDRGQQVHAARLGVLIFLASEALLFAGLFALYAAYRAVHPDAFAEGVRENLRWDGTANTFILLLGSGLAASALSRLHHGRARTASLLLKATSLLGVAFLALKGYEYAIHIHKGVLTGGRGDYFQKHGEPGLAQFFDLYWLMTGLHALHMIVGIIWVWIASRIARRGQLGLPHVELAALYWHFVDIIWVFLWPLFYLMGGGF